MIVDVVVRVLLCPPRPPTILVPADEFLLFGIDGNDRLTPADVSADLVVQIAELGVTVRMLFPFQPLAVRVEAETLLLQNVSDRTRTRRMTGATHRLRELPRRFQRPPQR